MKKFASKWGHLVAGFALAAATVNANSTCAFCFHQPKVPEAAKKLRKF